MPSDEKERVIKKVFKGISHHQSRTMAYVSSATNDPNKPLSLIHISWDDEIAFDQSLPKHELCFQ